MRAPSASVLPAVSVASLVACGAVIASLPAFAAVRDWVLAIEGSPLVSLAVATNVLTALTGSASGGLTVARDALGHNYMAIASQAGINPASMHRVAVIGTGTLDTLQHNGAVVTLLTLCRSSHRESYFDICHCRHRQPRARLDRGHHARHGVWVLKSALWSGRDVVNDRSWLTEPRPRLHAKVPCQPGPCGLKIKANWHIGPGCSQPTCN